MPYRMRHCGKLQLKGDGNTENFLSPFLKGTCLEILVDRDAGNILFQNGKT